MIERILVPTDGTERAAAALDTALRLAQLGGGRIVGVHATGNDVGGASAHEHEPEHERGPRLHERLPQAADTAPQASDALDYVVRRARAANVPCDTVLATTGPPHEAIVRAARDHGCDLIVMTMRGRPGLAGRLLAGTTQRVLADSAIPVLVLQAT